MRHISSMIQMSFSHIVESVRREFEVGGAIGDQWVIPGPVA
ncbi:hypothetical protein ACW4YW_12240 [Methylobacillus pratensis]